MGPVQWGTLGEWAAAVGTSSAVLITVGSRRRDLKDRREQEALRVAVGPGPSGGPPGPDGQPTTYMGVTVFNGSNRTIMDVSVVLASGSGDIQEWTYDEIPPGGTMAEIRQAQEDDWAKRPSRRTLRGTVGVSVAGCALSASTATSEPPAGPEQSDVLGYLTGRDAFHRRDVPCRHSGRP